MAPFMKEIWSNIV